MAMFVLVGSTPIAKSYQPCPVLMLGSVAVLDGEVTVAAQLAPPSVDLYICGVKPLASAGKTYKAFPATASSQLFSTLAKVVTGVVQVADATVDGISV